MVVDRQDDAAADLIFGALADPTRRDILARVLKAPSSVSGLAANYAMSFAAVQKHVAVLERAGLVSKQHQGRERLVRGDVHTIQAASMLLAQYEEIWRGRIDRLEQILTESPEGDAS